VEKTEPPELAVDSYVFRFPLRLLPRNHPQREKYMNRFSDFSFRDGNGPTEVVQTGASDSDVMSFSCIGTIPVATGEGL